MENLLPSPAMIDFGAVLVGDRVSFNAKWTNHSSHFVDIISFDPLETADHAFYVGSIYQPIRLFSGDDSPAYLFAFQPGAAGPFANRFTPVTAHGDARPIVVQGVGVWLEEAGSLQVARFLVNPTQPLDCGVVPIGEAGTAGIDVRNTSSALIDIGCKWQVGQFFSMSAPPPTIPRGLTIDPATGRVFVDHLGETLTVIFMPTGVGQVRDILNIVDPTGLDRIRVVVQGTGVQYGDGGCLAAPAVAKTSGGVANEIDFGDVIVGQTVRRAFYVTNSSDQRVFVRSRILGGNQGFAIQIPNPANEVIRARDQFGFVLSFTPPDVGAFADVFVIADDTHQHYVTRRLAGRGVEPM